MLKLKLQYFGHLIQRVASFEKTLMLGKIKGGRRRDDRGWDGWMASPTQWTWVGVNSGSWWWTGRPGVLQSMGSQRVKHDWATELNWCYQVQIPNVLKMCNWWSMWNFILFLQIRIFRPAFTNEVGTLPQRRDWMEGLGLNCWNYFMSLTDCVARTLASKAVR